MTARTSELLAVELDKVGLKGMAQMAREDMFHDYLSPLDFPELELVGMLTVAHSGCPDAVRRQQIAKLREDVVIGEYDADKAESDAWAASPEGQAAYNELLRGKK